MRYNSESLEITLVISGNVLLFKDVKISLGLFITARKIPALFRENRSQEVSSNMSKTRASASSRVPNTEKQMKARGRRPSAFICFSVFGTRDEARSPSF